MLVDSINSNLNLQRYKVLFVSGNYSRILSRLNRNITKLDVRCQRDGRVYRPAPEADSREEATVLVYSPAMDPHLEKMTQLADRVFCFYEMPKAPSKSRTKAEMKIPGSQATLEVFS